MKKTIIRPPKIYYNNNKEPYIIYNNKKYSLKGYSNKEIIEILNKLKNKNVNIEDVDKNKIIKLINDQIKQYLKERKITQRRGFIPNRRIRQTNEKLNNTKSQIKELIELLKIQLITKKDINEEIKKEKEINKYIDTKIKDINNNYKSIEDKDTIEKKKKIKEEEEYYNKLLIDKNEEIKNLDNYKEDLINKISELQEDKRLNKEEINNYKNIINNLDDQIKLKEKENNILEKDKNKIIEEFKQTSNINKKIMEKQKNKIIKQNLNKEIIDNNINKLKNENNKLNIDNNIIENKINKLVSNYNKINNDYNKISFMNENIKLKFEDIEKKYIEKGYIKKDDLLNKFGKGQSGKNLYNASQNELLNYIYNKKPEEKINLEDIIKEEEEEEKLNVISQIIKKVKKGERKEDIKVKKSSAQRIKEFKESSIPYKEEEENKPEENKPEQEGEGKNDNDEGLTDGDINKLMDPYKIYIKTISKDELDEMIKYIIDNNILKCCFIMNTLERDQYKEVGHWQAFYICLDDPYYSIEFFDSYGTKPDYKIINKFKNMIDMMKIPTFIKFKYNKIKQQYNNTSTCGLHSILFLIKRIYNISFRDATNFNKTIKETEEDVNKLKDFYEHFKLI